MKTQTALLVSTLLLGLSSVPALAQTPLWSLEGFDQPESVLNDKARQVLYISSINGAPLELNGKGYISRVSESGDMLDKQWVTGMDAPKGMAIGGDKLYVADMSMLRIVDIATGKLLESVTANGSKLLNDVTVADDGVVYITDMLAGGIYRYADGQLTRWFEHDDIPHPNGIHFHNGELLIVSWGKGIKDDFTTDELGSLFRLNPKTRTLTLDENVRHIGNLDGVGISGDLTITNDWLNGNVFAVDANGSKKLFNAGKSAADISVAKGKLYVPVMFEGRVDVYQMDTFQ